MSWVGQILLIINLPLVMAGKAHFPWLLALLLIFAPTLTSLLQLALSRTREYDADLEAAKLTKDPRGLASALSKLERISSNVFERILMPGGRIPDPSILRTHPSAKDRIDRLLEMEEDLGLKDSYPHEPEPVRLRQRPQIKITRPRRHLTGLWY
jgi:heat shock protein HtpX